MTTRTENPFTIVKASDFSDMEICDYWVDIPGGEGFYSIVKPLSKMPMMILGGKGSGKTHLMRYYSYHLQKIKHGENLIEGLKQDGFLGIYLKCGSMNSNRFSGKGFSDDQWASAFAYSFDIFIVQNLLDTIKEIQSVDNSIVDEKAFCSEAINLFDRWDSTLPRTISDLQSELVKIQKGINLSVNNCEYVDDLKIEILCSPGKLIYGIPEILSRTSDFFNGFVFTYLLDELENFNKEKQRYIQTLIRDREGPCSIKVGGRTYGIQTHETLTDGEYNREDHEFEQIKLDDKLRNISQKDYSTFSNNLCFKRLKDHGLTDIKSKDFNIADYLEEQTQYSELNDVKVFTSGKNGKTIKKLDSNLRDKEIKADKIYSFAEGDIEKITKNLSFEGMPILEMAAVISFYKNLKRASNLLELSEKTKKDAMSYINSVKGSHIESILGHHKLDIIAHLTNSHRKQHVYAGMDSLLDLSKGYPRHLITIMKHIYDCSKFNGEEPFKRGKISQNSQTEGVRAASKWFLDEMKISGHNGSILTIAINRIAELFRLNRFSDKPTESSLRSFYTDTPSTSDITRSLLKHASDWSILIKDSKGRKGKNSGDRNDKYILNAMLSPYWGLPTGLRGVIEIKPEELNCIFDPKLNSNFKEYKEQFTQKRVFPFSNNSEDKDQKELF